MECLCFLLYNNFYVHGEMETHFHLWSSAPHFLKSLSKCIYNYAESSLMTDCIYLWEYYVEYN